MLVMVVFSAIGLGLSMALAVDPAVAVPTAAPASSPLSNILMIVAIIVAGLVSWAAVMGAQKLGISISVDQQALLKSAAQSGIYYAEEMAAKKYGLDALAGKGGEMLKTAMDFVTSKIPGVDQAALQKEIHAALGAAPGLGASGATGAPASTP
jgi:hypothetical protein